MANKNIAIITSRNLSKDKIFDSTYARDNILERFKLLRDQFHKYGMACHTSDMLDPKTIDVLIFHDIMNELSIVLDIVYANPKVRLVYLANEPDIVIPYHKTEVLHELPVDLVLTWNKQAIEKYKAEHIKHLFIGQPVINVQNIPRIPFSKKKFISAIFAYKPSISSKSLFKERLAAIDYFSQQKPSIDLYGTNWLASNLSFLENTYCGACDNKLHVHKQYKFSIAYENSGSLPGLITEKIFDCFAAGTVPIYLGAPDIEKYIPASCFINFRQFKNYNDLYKHLTSLSESAYQEYLDAAKVFITTPQYMPFTSKYFAKQTPKYIKNIKNTPNTRKPIMIKYELLKLIIKRPSLLMHWRRYWQFFNTIIFKWPSKKGS